MLLPHFLTNSVTVYFGFIWNTISTFLEILIVCVAWYPVNNCRVILNANLYSYLCMYIHCTYNYRHNTCNIYKILLYTYYTTLCLIQRMYKWWNALIVWINRMDGRWVEKKSERERDRQMGWQKVWQTDGQIKSWTDKCMDKENDRQMGG